MTNAAASSALKKRAIKKLEIAAKQSAAVATQCIAAAQGAAASNRWVWSVGWWAGSDCFVFAAVLPGTRRLRLS